MGQVRDREIESGLKRIWGKKSCSGQILNELVEQVVFLGGSIPSRTVFHASSRLVRPIRWFMLLAKSRAASSA